MMRPGCRSARALAAALALFNLPCAAAASPPVLPTAWEPHAGALVELVRRATPTVATPLEQGHAWLPSDVTLTYSFRADGDEDSARSRTDAFDESLATEGVDLRWSQGRSTTEVHYLTLRTSWDFDGRQAAANRERQEASKAKQSAASACNERAERALRLHTERRRLQGELLGRQLPDDEVWARVARIEAINSELDLVTDGAWSRELASLCPAEAPRWLSGLDAD